MSERIVKRIIINKNINISIFDYNEKDDNCIRIFLYYKKIESDGIYRGYCSLNGYIGKYLLKKPYSNSLKNILEFMILTLKSGLKQKIFMKDKIYNMTIYDVDSLKDTTNTNP